MRPAVTVVDPRVPQHETRLGDDFGLIMIVVIVVVMVVVMVVVVIPSVGGRGDGCGGDADGYHGGSQEFLDHRQSSEFQWSPTNEASSMEFAKIGLNRK